MKSFEEELESAAKERGALYEEKLRVAVDILSFIEIESRDGSRFKFKELINEKAREALEKLKEKQNDKG